MSQTQDKRCTVQITWVPRTGTFRETERRTQVLRGRALGYSVKGRASEQDDENVAETESGDGCTTLWMNLMPLDFTLKNGLKWQTLWYVFLLYFYNKWCNILKTIGWSTLNRWNVVWYMNYNSIESLKSKHTYHAPSTLPCWVVGALERDETWSLCLKNSVW